MRTTSAAAAAEPRCSRRCALAAGAILAAVREGLELVTSNNASGFRAVTPNKGKFQVKVGEGGMRRNLGRFDTAEEAALAYVRHVGKERAAREAAETRGEGPQPLSAEQARAAAEREGLELVPASNACGFKGVTQKPSNGKFITASNACGFKATASSDGEQHYLGIFDTAEEAALAYACRFAPATECWLSAVDEERSLAPHISARCPRQTAPE